MFYAGLFCVPFRGYFFARISHMRGVGDENNKKINTSAALALDSAGREIVVLGKGIGFPKVPYELTDLSKIERTFYDVDSRYLGMIESLPQSILFASADIAEDAEIELDCQLNPNLPLTLADHLNFAVERLKSGINLTAPIAYDISHLYPREYALGNQALLILKEKTGIELSAHEAISVALHLINAETENGDLHNFLTMMQIINEVDDIIEKALHFKLDKDSYNYSRFATHMRYLIQRLQSDTQTENQVNTMLRTLMREYPDIYLCALKDMEYFRSQWNWQCTDDEIVYLMMHIHRVKDRT